MLTTEQQTARATCITATDMGAILGVNKYRSPIDVWLHKTGRGPAHVGNERTKWGDLLEPVIRDDYADRHRCVVRQVGTVIREYGNVRISATPDGVIEPTHGLEIKTHSVYAAEYGRPGSDDVPPHIAVQCHVGMLVLGIAEWHLVAFRDGVPTDYVIKADDAAAREMVAFAQHWWATYVVGHKMPPTDGSDASATALRNAFPGIHRSDAVLRPATAEDMAEVSALREQRAARVYAERLEESAAQRVQALIGDDDGIEWADGDKTRRVTWKRASDSRKVDYAAALTDYHQRLRLALSASGEGSLMTNLRSAVEHGPDLDTYTTTTPGSRRFIVPKEWSK